MRVKQLIPAISHSKDQLFWKSRPVILRFLGTCCQFMAGACSSIFEKRSETDFTTRTLNQSRCFACLC